MVNVVAGAYAEQSPLVVLSGSPGVRERQERDLLHHNDPSAIAPMQPKVAPSYGTISMSGLLYELNQFIDSNTLLVTDVGDALFAADDIKTESGTSFLCPAFYASMGFGVPGVIGARLANPVRRAIVLKLRS